MINAVYVTTLLTHWFTQLGLLIGIVVGSVVVGLVALMGLGFGIRKIGTHITGGGVSGASYRVGTEDEYPKKFRDSFTEAVGIYNKAHPE